nr:hypothetical protein [Ningiella sp. W23]
MKTAAEIANIKQNLDTLDWTDATAKTKGAASALPDNIKRLEVSLMGEEERLKDSYEKRKQMVIVARENDAANKVKYDAILKQLDVKYGEDLKAISQKRETEKTRIQNQAEEKRKNDLQRDLENRIATVKGFAGREALAAYNNELSVEQARQQARVDAKRRSQLGLAANDESGELKYNADNQIRELERQTELNAANGYYSQREASEAAHQERLMQIKTRHTGALQSNILAFANFEKKQKLKNLTPLLAWVPLLLKQWLDKVKQHLKPIKRLQLRKLL